MKELNKEQKLIFAILIAVTVLSVLLASGFAALFLSSAHTGNDSIPTNTEPWDTEPEDTREPVSADTEELVRLRQKTIIINSRQSLRAMSWKRCAGL